MLYFSMSLEQELIFESEYNVFEILQFVTPLFNFNRFEFSEPLNKSKYVKEHCRKSLDKMLQNPQLHYKTYPAVFLFWVFVRAIKLCYTIQILIHCNVALLFIILFNYTIKNRELACQQDFSKSGFFIRSLLFTLML